MSTTAKASTSEGSVSSDVIEAGPVEGLSDFTSANRAVQIPILGLQPFNKQESRLERQFLRALEIGYRRFDILASKSKQSRWLGEFMNELGPGFDRTQLTWVLHVNSPKYQESSKSLRKVVIKHLERLGLPAFNVVIMGEDPKGTTSSDKKRRKTWNKFEELMQAGLTRSIGTLGMTKTQLRTLRDEDIPPQINYLKYFSCFEFPKLRRTLRYCEANGICVAYLAEYKAFRNQLDNDKALGGAVYKSGARNIVKHIAKKEGVGKEEVCTRYLLQHNIAVTLDPRNKPKDLYKRASVFDFAIEQKDMRRLNTCNPDNDVTSSSDSRDNSYDDLYPGMGAPFAYQGLPMVPMY